MSTGAFPRARAVRSIPEDEFLVSPEGRFWTEIMTYYYKKFEWTAFTEADLLANGTNGCNFGKGDSFVMGSPSVKDVDLRQRLEAVG